MDYKILVLTISTPVPTGSSSPGRYEPWFNASRITMPDAKLSTITVSDSDGKLENVQLAVTETEQRLVESATFGSGGNATTIAAGTQLNYAFNSIIRDDAGNEFLVTFPRIGTGLTPSEIGGKTSVLVFPRPVKNADGTVKLGADGKPVFPQFDPARTFTYAGRDQYSSTNYGLSYSYPSAVDCFAAGTLIDTLFGPRPVEQLRVGDMIRTRDNGMRWLSWIGGTRVDAARLDLQPNLRPIRIAAGALGHRLPFADLILSPQHRVLVRSAITQRMFGEVEILVAAKHLVGMPGIEVIVPDDGVTYFHMLFDGHELVLSNGAWTESLFTGAQALEAVGDSARREIVALFPHLSDPDFRPEGARRFLKGREGRQLAERHRKNGKALCDTLAI
ncbi:Hint domain-containing protein [Paracoccus sp. TK19116]|uniref:Hint domain-containing protein n=1 Tax=Paracoccus albicereus TaxID=2922394 RepID=A0ABT1MU85_9RHOB|nr:Hint domain-containing protein [Paracoccus albicereus]MCQ0971870.1 Hint domain-containing protein [Paracoccus albicereus]